jgi:hypothetical protein
MQAERGDAPPLVQRWLYSGFAQLTLQRVDARTLDVQAPSGFVREQTERLFRGDAHPLQLGQRIELAGFRAQILALTADHLPKRVRFVFDRPLEDPSYLWLAWRDDDFAPFEPPPPGEVRTLTGADFASTMLGPDHPVTRLLARRRSQAAALAGAARN